MTSTSRSRSTRARSATGIALAATMLTSLGVAAQSPSTTPAPEATTAPSVPTPSTDRPMMGDRHGFGRGGDLRGGRGFWGPGRAGPGFGDRGFERRGFGAFGLRGIRAGSGVTVASTNGTDLVLTTPDGWTRTIDTTGVVLTRDGATIALGDIQVGEPVRVAQTRNADGSYTVTGIQVLPAVATGTVGTASTDGFTVVGSDGSTTTVSVTPETTWAARGASSASLTDATAGRSVAVEGTLQADGSIVATRVLLG